MFTTYTPATDTPTRHLPGRMFLISDRRIIDRCDEGATCPVYASPAFDHAGEEARCEHCGETFSENDSRAEVWNPSDDTKASLIVHAEPCAYPELITQRGWEIA